MDKRELIQILTMHSKLSPVVACVEYRTDSGLKLSEPMAIHRVGVTQIPGGEAICIVLDNIQPQDNEEQ